MDENQMEGHSGGCNCSKCCCGHGKFGGNDMHGMCGRRHWMHLLIKILIAVFIFWCGVKFGELQGMIRADHYNYGNYSGYGMTQNQ